MKEILSKKCEYCGKIFNKKASHSLLVWNTEVKFCCKGCYTLSMKGKAPTNGTLFKKGEIPWNKGKKLPQYTAENNSRYTRVELTCIYCGNKYTVKNYRKDESNYCSCKCKHNDNNDLTSKNYRERRSTKYNDWRTSVFVRDNYTCQECGIRNKKGVGKTIKLQAHHIKPFAYFKKERYDINNGQTLCEECHKKTDTFGIVGYRRLMAVTEEP